MASAPFEVHPTTATTINTADGAIKHAGLNTQTACDTEYVEGSESESFIFIGASSKSLRSGMKAPKVGYS
jgi:hypothetical protein